MIRTGEIPEHPSYVDYLSSLSDWQMLGNADAGNCVSVTWANKRRLITATLTDKEYYPTQDQVWEFYRTQNPNFDPNGGDANGPGSNSDNGMVVQSALDELHQVGGPDGVPLVAFARVDLHNHEEVKAAIASCGSLWTGINVHSNNEDEFSQEVPWDFVMDSPSIGGHSVITGGYGTTTDLTRELGGDEKFITWAAETSFTPNYWSCCVDEAWVTIWPEHLGNRSFEQGVSGGLLASVYRQVTGSQLVLP